MYRGRASTIRKLASLARQIKEEARANPNSPYKGKLVGIADGRVVAVDDNLDVVVRDLRRAEADPRKMFCVEAGVDYDEVRDVWGIG
jgi:hypothetical protein